MGIAALITLLVYHRKMEMINPVYDYERIIFESLDTHNSNKHLLIKKATGLGISEFMLRFMAWLCLKDNALSGSLMCIVTGPRIDLAIALTQRMKEVTYRQRSKYR
jgi:late competence protein required for DNA uptake (superfamily II DNA/RNA helicase)